MKPGPISNNRRLNPIAFCCKGKSDIFKYLPGNGNFFLVDSGRGGLHAIISILGLQPGSTVLMPAFVAEGAIAPFLKKNINVRLYDVGVDLQVDPVVLDKLMLSDNSIRALLCIHYFGFPQPVAELKKICHKNGVYLIEDCAQALFSKDEQGRVLGTRGDISFFSLGKSLPVPDGAVFFINNENLSFNSVVFKLSIRGRVQALFQSFYLVSAWLAQVLRSGIIDRYIAGGFYRLAYQCLRRSGKPCKISGLSLKILANLSYEDIIKKRQLNASYLYEHLQTPGLSFIRPELNENYCLLAVPMLARNRRQILDELARGGVNCLGFRRDWNFIPQSEEEQYPNSARFVRELFALPVYQDLSEKQMRYMTMALSKLI